MILPVRLNIKLLVVFRPSLFFGGDRQQSLPVLVNSMPSAERFVKIIQVFSDFTQEVFGAFTGLKRFPLLHKYQAHFIRCHVSNLRSRQIVAKNEVALDGLEWRDARVQFFPTVSGGQPVTQPLQAKYFLTGGRIFRRFPCNVPEVIRPYMKEGLLSSLIVEEVKIINAGRWLLFCIHIFSPGGCLMGMKTLSAPSDQSGETHWSEIVPSVKGRLLPSAVRLAPFFNPSPEVFHG